LSWTAVNEREHCAQRRGVYRSADLVRPLPESRWFRPVLVVRVAGISERSDLFSDRRATCEEECGEVRCSDLSLRVVSCCFDGHQQRCSHERTGAVVVSRRCTLAVEPATWWWSCCRTINECPQLVGRRVVQSVLEPYDKRLPRSWDAVCQWMVIFGIRLSSCSPSWNSDG